MGESELTRTYSSFDAAAREAAESRLYAGIHYRYSADVGIERGRLAAERVMRQAAATTN